MKSIRTNCMPLLVIAIAVAAVSAGASLIYSGRLSDPKPDTMEMRAFRIRQLTDNKIHELHAEAEAEALRLKSIDDESRSAAWKEVAERSNRCADLVYKTRNDTECNRGIPLGLLYPDTHLTPSAERLFEDSLLGVCRYISTTSEARKIGCLTAN